MKEAKGIEREKIMDMQRRIMDICADALCSEAKCECYLEREIFAEIYRMARQSYQDAERVERG